MISENYCDNVHAVLSGISTIYNPVKLHDILVKRRDVGTFAASIGWTTVGSKSHYIIDDTTNEELGNQPSDDDNSCATVTEWDTKLLDEFDADLDNLISSTFVGATVGTKSQDVSAKHLSKVWRIDPNTAQNTLEITTQLLQRNDKQNLSRKYSTNDRMIRYK